MKETAPEHLYLEGRIQVQISILALELTGLNDGMRLRLQALLDLQDKVMALGQGDEMEATWRGKEVAQDKADILTSLSILSAHADTSDGVRLAAAALYDMMI